MKTISIVHKKGGAGKTTLAYMLASGALNLGLKVHLIDGDRNLQLANWKHRSEEYNWEIERPQWPHNLTHENLHGSIGSTTAACRSRGNLLRSFGQIRYGSVT
jgi:cellulose biosynthesis protein BcsQ